MNTKKLLFIAAILISGRCYAVYDKALGNISATSITASSGTFSNGTITGTPSQTNDIANKFYVDTVATGLSVRDSVMAATTGQIALSGLIAVDSYTAVAGDRILVKNQASIANGIYIAASGAWSRSSDYAVSAQILAGTFVAVTSGTINNNTQWVEITTGVVVGVSTPTFSKLSQGQSYTAGTGLSLSLNQFSITGTVGAGSCTNCNATFNAQGQATAFSNGSAGGGGGGGVNSGTIGQNAYYAVAGTTVSGSSNMITNTSSETFNVTTKHLFGLSSSTGFFTSDLHVQGSNGIFFDGAGVPNQNFINPPNMAQANPGFFHSTSTVINGPSIIESANNQDTLSNLIGVVNAQFEVRAASQNVTGIYQISPPGTFAQTAPYIIWESSTGAVLSQITAAGAFTGLVSSFPATLSIPNIITTTISATGGVGGVTISTPLFVVSGSTLPSTITTGLTVTGGPAILQGINSATVSSAGNYGEKITSAAFTATNLPTTTNWGDLVSVALTTGAWSITFQACEQSAGATITSGAFIGVSLNSGNNGTGFNYPDTEIQLPLAATTDGCGVISSFLFNTASTQTIYGKMEDAYSLGQPTMKGIIRAIRAY